MALETILWDPTKRLTTPAAISAYLQAALEDGDFAVIVVALDDITRARAQQKKQAKRGPRDRTPSR